MIQNCLFEIFSYKFLETKFRRQIYYETFKDALYQCVSYLTFAALFDLCIINSFDIVCVSISYHPVLNWHGGKFYIRCDDIYHRCGEIWCNRHRFQQECNYCLDDFSDYEEVDQFEEDGTKFNVESWVAFLKLIFCFERKKISGLIFDMNAFSLN